MARDEVKSAYAGAASDTTCNENMRTETNICSSQNTEARFTEFLNHSQNPRAGKKIQKADKTWTVLL